jgi:hypothetical protein
VLAYHPLFSEAVLRVKDAAGLDGWFRRRWQMFNGLSPVIIDATDSLQALVERDPAILQYGPIYAVPVNPDDMTLVAPGRPPADALRPALRSFRVRDDWRNDLPGHGVAVCDRCKFVLDDGRALT